MATQARQGKARQGKARQSKAKQGQEGGPCLCGGAERFLAAARKLLPARSLLLFQQHQHLLGYQHPRYRPRPLAHPHSRTGIVGTASTACRYSRAHASAIRGRALGSLDEAPGTLGDERADGSASLGARVESGDLGRPLAPQLVHVCLHRAVLAPRRGRRAARLLERVGRVERGAGEVFLSRRLQPCRLNLAPRLRLRRVLYLLPPPRPPRPLHQHPRPPRLPI